MPSASSSAPSPELVSAYLDRLGLDAEPPSVDALQRLHRAQVERVPYETLWIHEGGRWGIDLAGSLERIARGGRGGYCFHLNGAFGELLTALGYSVTRHVGGVHGPAGPFAADLTNHLVLTVDGLATAEHPTGGWYVDAGLGDALHEAVPLVAGPFRQGPFSMALAKTADGWHLAHDPAGGFSGMAWRSAAATMDQFAERHAWLSTSPESGFVRVGTAQRRDARGVDIVRGLVLTRVEDGSTSIELTERDDWFAVLADLFGLRSEDRAADRLWTATIAAHRAWDDAGRP